MTRDESGTLRQDQMPLTGLADAFPDASGRKRHAAVRKPSTAGTGRPASEQRSRSSADAAETAVETGAPERFIMACQDNLSFMRALPAEAFKLIVTSPPYNLGKSYEGRTKLDSYLAEQERVIDECVRLLDERGSLCWQVGNYVENGEIVPLDTLLYPMFRSHGLKLRNRIVWQFGHGLHCTKRLSGRYETINWWTKGDDYTWHLNPIRIPSKYPNKRHFKGPIVGQLSGNPKGKNPSDVWAFPNVKNNHPEKTVHPC